MPVRIEISGATRKTPGCCSALVSHFVQEVSGEILRFAAPLRHHAALRVLLALEAEPHGMAELVELLDIEPDAAEYVVDMLKKAGLIAQVRIEPADPLARTRRRIYGTRHVGWEGVRQALADIKPRPATDDTLSR
jgi:hypothetical protein